MRKERGQKPDLSKDQIRALKAGFRYGLSVPTQELIESQIALNKTSKTSSSATNS